MQAVRAYSRHEINGEERAEEELRDFSYIVSHDLATEFRHVAEFSKFLLTDLPAESEARSSAEIIVSAARRCQAMLDQVRIYSRVQERPPVKPINAERLIETVVLQASGAINNVGASLGIDVSGEIVGDEEQLREAFTRVLLNALMFARPGVAPVIEISGKTDLDGCWRAQVRDNGTGLPSEYWEKAFRMFWRLDPQGRVDGVGAGLTICRRIIRQHGGDVGFIECDGGACVEVTLPGCTVRATEGVKEAAR